MTVWKDTYPDLFKEADAAKERAKRQFLLGLHNPARVPEEKLIALVDAMTTAQWQALLTHIGPVSGDGSVSIGVAVNSDGVPQLDLRAAAAWPQITYDPSAVGYDKPVLTIAWQTDGSNPVALWVKKGTATTAWAQIWPGTAASNFYHVLADIDYTLLANSGAIPDGDFTVSTLDGQHVVHTMAHASAASYHQIELGVGLRIQTHSTGAEFLNLDEACRVHVALPALSAGLDPNDKVQEWWFWYQFDAWTHVGADPVSTHANDNGQEVGVLGAVTTNPKTTFFSRGGLILNRYGVSDLTTSYKVSFVEGCVSGTTPNASLIGQNSSADPTTPDADTVIVIRLIDSIHVEMYTGVWSSGFPNRKDLKLRGAGLLGQAVGSPYFLSVWRSGFTEHSLAALFSVNGTHVADIGARDYTGILKRLKIEAGYASRAAVVTGGSGGGGGQPFHDVAIVSGGISGFGSNTNLRVTSGTGPLTGIEAPITLDDGTEISVTFTSDTDFTSMGSTALAPIKGPFSGGSYLSLTVPADEEVRLKLRRNGGSPYWKYIGGSAS